MRDSGGICGWTYVLSHDARPPAAGAAFGATITPAQDTYGSYATVLGTPLSNTAYGIEITIGGIGLSATITDSLTTIGIDPAGGTSYSAFITDLLCTAANAGVAEGIGYKYFFPVRIPAGATIGAKGSIHNATVGVQYVSVKLWTLPTHPEFMPKVGSYVTTFGADTANSAGTSVTAGTGSQGSYTQLGSAITGLPLWYWLVASASKNDSSHLAGISRTDLAVGDASNKKIVVTDQNFAYAANERISAYIKGEYGVAPVGALVYARIWAPSSDTAYGAIAYGVGG